MSDPIPSKTSDLVPPTEGDATQPSASVPDTTTVAEVAPALLANFAPLPSALGVTYSMI